MSNLVILDIYALATNLETQYGTNVDWHRRRLNAQISNELVKYSQTNGTNVDHYFA